MSAPPSLSPEALFASHFLPLYPPEARGNLEVARRTDANPAKNPAITAHLAEAAALFVANAPRLLGEELTLDYSDASVHRLSSLVAKKKHAWLASNGAGTPDNLLFNVVVHGAAYLGECIVRSHKGTWNVRRPLWESSVHLVSAAGEADLNVFQWWLKSLATGGTDTSFGLAERYRTHVETPSFDPASLPTFITATPRSLPRLTKIRYDVFYKYLKANLPELSDLGKEFPSPERFAEYDFRFLEFLVLGEGRVVLVWGAGKGGLYLFWLGSTGFLKSAFYPTDSAPDPKVSATGNKLAISLVRSEKRMDFETLYWGP